MVPHSTLCAGPEVGARITSEPVPVLPAYAPVPVRLYLPTRAAPAGPVQKVALVSVFVAGYAPFARELAQKGVPAFTQRPSND